MQKRVQAGLNAPIDKAAAPRVAISNTPASISSEDIANVCMAQPIRVSTTKNSPTSTIEAKNQPRAMRVQFSASNIANAGMAGITYRAERWLGNVNTSSQTVSQASKIHSSGGQGRAALR